MSKSSRARKTRRMLALVAAFGTLVAAQAEAQQDREAALSGLVRIRCKLDSGGEMASTGETLN